MQKLNLKEVPKLKPDPIFKGFSDELKDPKNFMKIEKQLAKILKVTHKHKTTLSYSKCPMCQAKRVERQTKMKELGFQSIIQYMQWKKIHTIIKDKKSFQLK